ncbi:MAG: sulfurtransferase [Anaerolineae bacterium]|nr:sulfurtransferase [Anaerolineae bacterium]
MSDPVPPLVSVDWLARRLDDRQARIADVRWYLPHLGKSGVNEYQAGHIPGAVFLDLDTELSAPRGEGPGRHPLPTAMNFGAAMRRAGVNSDTHVVAYDDGGGTAVRLWWLLRYFGHERVSLLDGGLRAWQAAGRPLETGAGRIMPPGNLIAHPKPDWVVDKEEVARLAAAGAVILDARARERYEGKVEPIDARPGHIPGAHSAPFTENVGADGRFLDPAQLTAKYATLGVDKAKTVVAYCGSGVTACHTIFALHLTGRTDAKLYEGSWSDWAADSTLPAAMGPAADAMPRPN